MGGDQTEFAFEHALADLQSDFHKGFTGQRSQHSGIPEHESGEQEFGNIGIVGKADQVTCEVFESERRTLCQVFTGQVLGGTGIIHIDFGIFIHDGLCRCDLGIIDLTGSGDDLAGFDHDTGTGDRGKGEAQLSRYFDLLRKKKIEGIVFCSSTLGDAPLATNRILKDYIKRYGDEEIPE